MSESNEKLRPKNCRELFENNILKEHKFIQVIDQAICMKVVRIEVIIQKNQKQISLEMKFRLVYEGKNICALPEKHDDSWIIYPQDVGALYI